MGSKSIELVLHESILTMIYYLKLKKEKASLHTPLSPHPPPSQWPGMGSKRSGAGLARLHHLPSAVSVQCILILIFFANVQGQPLLEEITFCSATSFRGVLLCLNDKTDCRQLCRSVFKVILVPFYTCRIWDEQACLTDCGLSPPLPCSSALNCGFE